MNKEKENIIKKNGVCEDYLVICDHASNNIPLEYENLGISKKDLESHRAFDLGAYEVAGELSNLLSCSLVMANFSRLLIGNDYKYVLPFSALIGGLTLSTADLIARSGPIEVPVGIVTSLLGAPIFIIILYRRSSKKIGMN